MDDINAFLTEVDVKPRDKKHPKLANVRKEHGRLMEVVATFGDKVNYMVDRQRSEYMHAYEQHMYDVQKELHQLREKVTEIANDKTRDEKIQQLSSDQVKFRHEALFYDEAAAGLRKKIKRLKEAMQKVESERDWLLKKLREEKQRYNFLKDERAKFAKFDSSSSMSSASNDSSYSIELMHSSNKPTTRMVNKVGNPSFRSEEAHWKSRLQADVTAVNRDSALVSSLPLLLSSQPRPQSIASPPNPRAEVPKEKSVLGDLVSLRARQEAIRDFVRQCSISCRKPSWERVQRWETNEVISSCLDILSDEQNSREIDRQRLVYQLILLPETYFVLSEILTGKREKFQSTLNMELWSQFDNSQRDLDDIEPHSDWQNLLQNDFSRPVVDDNGYAIDTEKEKFSLPQIRS